MRTTQIWRVSCSSVPLMTELSNLRERSSFDAPLTSWSKLRVAVVEPYASGRDTICACIEELGHGAVGASSLEHAVRLGADGDLQPIDLFLITHYLPWIDGWGLVARLRSACSVPAIVVCDACDDVPNQRNLTMRPSFSLEDLETALDKFARNHRAS